MNYIFVQLGSIPNYLKYSINAVKKIDIKAQIHLITDKFFEDSEINIHNVNELESQDIKYLKNLKYFDDWNLNPLWETSLLRIFYISNLIKKNNLKENIHFDSDVIVLQPFENIKNYFDKEKFNLTPIKNNEFVFGYSFINEAKIIEVVCDELIKIYENADRFSKRYFSGKKLTEMKSLYIASLNYPTLINSLPVLPSDNPIVFDPASYGQYIYGTHNKIFSKGFIDETHIVSDLLASKNLKFTLNSEKSGLSVNENFYNFANLHIHSKKLKKVYKKLITTN